MPADWVHPPDEHSTHRPLLCDYEADVAAWERNAENPGDPFEYNEPRPDAAYYMLVGVPASARTHFQMYETCSEGTPISPVFATPEDLARWLVDNKASAFGGMTASYEAWLDVARGNWAPSAVRVVGGPMMSGVEAMHSMPKRQP